MDDQFEKDKEIERLKARCQAFLDSNNSTMAVSKAALRGAFILNGAAALSIVYAKAEMFTGLAVWFGWGAFWACVATGLAYFTSFIITESWREDIGQKPFLKCKLILYLSYIPPIGVTIYSYYYFFSGLLRAEEALSNEALVSPLHDALRYFSTNSTLFIQ